MKTLGSLMKFFLLPLFAVGAMQAGQRQHWGDLFECVTSAVLTAYSAAKLDDDINE
jgi:hypothetical protein